MKRYIKAASYEKEVIAESKDGMFTLVKEKGEGREDTPWEGLAILSSGLAEKHVVDIRLKVVNFPTFNGEPVRYEYGGVYVSHGMRSVMDTLDETEEYIKVLESALDFAKGMDKYIAWWNKKVL